VDETERKPTPLKYAAPASSGPLPPHFAVLLLCMPMLLVGFLMVPAPLRPVTPLPLYRWFWAVQVVAMLCALISIFLLCDSRVRRWPWFARINLLINIPGLAVCTFAILRYVVVNMPSPN
jgi:hypothetical protein